MKSVHIKVLVNSKTKQLKRERLAVDVTLKGCLHLIFDNHLQDALFNILN
jgi:hypothetical protein